MLKYIPSKHKTTVLVRQLNFVSRALGQPLHLDTLPWQGAVRQCLSNSTVSLRRFLFHATMHLRHKKTATHTFKVRKQPSCLPKNVLQCERLQTRSQARFLFSPTAKKTLLSVCSITRPHKSDHRVDSTNRTCTAECALASIRLGLDWLGYETATWRRGPSRYSTKARALARNRPWPTLVLAWRHSSRLAT